MIWGYHYFRKHPHQSRWTQDTCSKYLMVGPRSRVPDKASGLAGQAPAVSRWNSHKFPTQILDVFKKSLKKYFSRRKRKRYNQRWVEITYNRNWNLSVTKFEHLILSKVHFTWVKFTDCTWIERSPNIHFPGLRRGVVDYGPLKGWIPQNPEGNRILSHLETHLALNSWGKFKSQNLGRPTGLRENKSSWNSSNICHRSLHFTWRHKEANDIEVLSYPYPWLIYHLIPKCCMRLYDLRPFKKNNKSNPNHHESLPRMCLIQIQWWKSSAPFWIPTTSVCPLPRMLDSLLKME